MRTKLALTLDDAKKLMAAAEEEATRNKWEVVIAILNDGGRIVAVHRMDGARPGNDQIAIAKATTSAMTCRPSAVWERWIEGPHKAYATFPFIAAQGGLPIIIDGDLIGAIGVSGVSSSEDEQIALAAIRRCSRRPRPRAPARRTTRRRSEPDTPAMNRSEIADGMRIDWDCALPMEDGAVLRADLFRRSTRPLSGDPHLRAFGKGLAFQDGFGAWDRMIATFIPRSPGVPPTCTRSGSWSIRRNGCRTAMRCVRVDSRGAGRSPGYLDPWSPRETQDSTSASSGPARSPGAAARSA